MEVRLVAKNVRDELRILSGLALRPGRAIAGAKAHSSLNARIRHD
jgi:hypothetical protein